MFTRSACVDGHVFWVRLKLLIVWRISFVLNDRIQSWHSNHPHYLINILVLIGHRCIFDTQLTQNMSWKLINTIYWTVCLKLDTLAVVLHGEFSLIFSEIESMRRGVVLLPLIILRFPNAINLFFLIRQKQNSSPRFHFKRWMGWFFVVFFLKLDTNYKASDFSERTQTIQLSNKAVGSGAPNGPWVVYPDEWQPARTSAGLTRLQSFHTVGRVFLAARTAAD